MPRGGTETVKPALIRLLHGFLCIGTHLFIVLGLDYRLGFMQTEEFVTYKTLFHRTIYFYMAMTGGQFMYYSPWCISDAAMIACGLAYSGKENGKHTWNRIYNVDIYGLMVESVSCV